MQHSPSMQCLLLDVGKGSRAGFHASGEDATELTETPHHSSADCTLAITLLLLPMLVPALLVLLLLLQASWLHLPHGTA